MLAIMKYNVLVEQIIMKIGNKLGNSASKIEVKPYFSLYASEICDLFHSSIHAIDTDIYSKTQYSKKHGAQYHQIIRSG